MLLTCPGCKTKNFLDPYPFWNFKGTTRCAGCGKIWRIETAVGACVAGPEAADGKADLLPGFAEKPDYSPITGPGVTRAARRAHEDSVCRTIPIQKNASGKTVSGNRVKPDAMDVSRTRVIALG